MVMAATQTQITFPVAIPREAARQVRCFVWTCNYFGKLKRILAVCNRSRRDGPNHQQHARNEVSSTARWQLQPCADTITRTYCANLP